MFIGLGERAERGEGEGLQFGTPADTHRLRVIEDHLETPCICDVLASLDRDPNYELKGDFVTVQLDAGRKQKVRPGDILGALTGDAGLPGDQIGKITILDYSSFVAILRPRFDKR